MLKSFVKPMVNNHDFSFIVFAFSYKNYDREKKFAQ